MELIGQREDPLALDAPPGLEVGRDEPGGGSQDHSEQRCLVANRADRLLRVEHRSDLGEDEEERGERGEEPDPPPGPRA